MPTKGDPRSSIALKLDEGLPPLPTRQYMPASYRPVTPPQPTFDPFYTTDLPGLPPGAAAPSPINHQWPGGSGEDQSPDFAETVPPPTAETRGDYKVGYKTPPKQHQFPKGVSGHRDGRPRKPPPKDPPDLRARLKAMAAEENLVDGKSITGQEEMLRAILALARQGKVSALKYLLGIEDKLLKGRRFRFILERDDGPEARARPPKPKPAPPTLRGCLDQILAETISVDGKTMSRQEDLCRCIYELARQGKLSMVKWVCPVPAKPVEKGGYFDFVVEKD